MGRPLFITGFAFLFATRIAFLFDGRDALLLSFAAALTAVFCFILRGRFKYMQETCAVFLSACAAFAGFALYYEREVAPVNSLAGETVVVDGLITDIGRGVRSFSYTLEASLPHHPGTPESFPLVVQSMTPLEADPGDAVWFTATLVPAGDSVWYRSRGIGVIGRNVQNFETVPADRFQLRSAFLRLREAMAGNVYAKLPEESASLISATLLGQRSNISPEISTAMGKAGTAHLLTVSGLHLSILSGFMLKTLGKSRFGAFIAILSSFLFVLLVGFSASVLRSFVMTAIALSGRLISKRSDSLNSLGFALIVCCAAAPYWTLGWGLWISAGSTLGIILFSAPISEVILKRMGTSGRIASFVSNAGGISIAAYAFTLPVLLLMSGWISIISPLSNILVSPFVTVAILGGMVCAIIPGTPLIGIPAAVVTDFVTQAIIRVSKVMGASPIAIIAMDESYLLIWFLGVCATAAVLLKYRAGKRLVTYACALLAVSLSLGSLSLEAANRDRIELVTLSGYHAAILLRGREAVILGAPDAYEITNMLQYLDFRSVRDVPVVIAPDSGSNVSSGMIRLHEAYGPALVLGPNDAAICENISDALPGAQVYSGGYAAVAALGKATVYIDMINNDIYVDIGDGRTRIVKTRRDFDMPRPGGEIRIFNEGVMLLPEHIPPAFEPMGAYLYGESRVLLR